MPKIIGTPEWDKILKRLKDNDKTLTQLDLFDNQIGASGAQDISRALKDNRTLTQLNLRHNAIGDSGAQGISRALKENRTLAHLDLSYNAIGASGAKDLSLALKDNRTLTRLDLIDNKIGTSGAKDLSWALKDNLTLTQLDLNGNEIGASGAKDLSWALKENQTLTQLDLSSNWIGDSGAKDLSLALKDNRTLTKLILSWNQIGDSGAKDLSWALKENRTLTYLYLGISNKVGDSLINEIKQQLAENNAYQKQVQQKPTLPLATVATNPSLQLSSLQHTLPRAKPLTASATPEGKPENGRGVMKDKQKALSGYEQAAKQKYGEATLAAGRLKAEFNTAEASVNTTFSSIKNAEQALPDPIKRLKIQAESGEAHAQYSLGATYMEGQGIFPNPKLAFDWCLKAAQQDYAPAQFVLAVGYAEGQAEGWPVKCDPLKALHYFQKAAQGGHLQAQYYLAIRYEKGIGVTKDTAEAMAWYEQAAECGYIAAQYILGNRYEVSGQGIKAVYWYEKAALQGHFEAPYKLGKLYQAGQLVQYDENKAFSWFRKAVEQKHEGAINALNKLKAKSSKAKQPLAVRTPIQPTPKELAKTVPISGTATLSPMSSTVASWIEKTATTRKLNEELKGANAEPSTSAVNDKAILSSERDLPPPTLAAHFPRYSLPYPDGKSATPPSQLDHQVKALLSFIPNLASLIRDCKAQSCVEASYLLQVTRYLKELQTYYETPLPVLEAAPLAAALQQLKMYEMQLSQALKSPPALEKSPAALVHRELLDPSASSRERKFDFTQLFELAQSGSLYEQIMLGLMYLAGYRVGQDFEKALKWFEKPAEKKSTFSILHYIIIKIIEINNSLSESGFTTNKKSPLKPPTSDKVKAYSHQLINHSNKDLLTLLSENLKRVLSNSTNLILDKHYFDRLKDIIDAYLIRIHEQNPEIFSKNAKLIEEYHYYVSSLAVCAPINSHKLTEQIGTVFFEYASMWERFSREGSRQQQSTHPDIQSAYLLDKVIAKIQALMHLLGEYKKLPQADATYAVQIEKYLEDTLHYYQTYSQVLSSQRYQEIDNDFKRQEDYLKSALSAAITKPATAPVSAKGEEAAVYSPSLEQLKISFTIPYAQLKLGHLLGKGTYGAVYQATWRYNLVAIKQLHSHHLSTGATAEFQHELQMMSQLRSPNIVQFYGAVIDQSPYGLVMEYMPKGSLFGVLHNQEPLSWPLRETLALDIAKGLAYLHHENILHRDLKSVNVLLDAHYRAKLTDFGLAKVKTEVSSTSSASSTKVVGTYAWMAPEIMGVPKPAYSPRSDMYAYGVVLWELAARDIPLKEARGDYQIIKEWVKTYSREDVDEIPAETPPKLAKLMRFCWAVAPEQRPSAGQAIEQLQEDFVAESAALPTYQENLASLNSNAGPTYLSNTYTKR